MPKSTKTQSPFARRLREAFGGAGPKEIGEKIGYKPSFMTDIMNGSSYPSVDKLILITELTKCDLHWLLTGEGGEKRDPLEYLGEAERRIVRELGGGKDADAEALVAELVGEGVAARAARLLARRAELSEDERRELRLLVTLTEEPEELRPAPRKGSIQRPAGRKG